MKKIIKPTRTQISSAILSILISQSIHAGAFSLYTEASPAAIGNFAAGIAAEASDPSIGWYNPAGLVLLKKQQALIGGVGVFPSSDVSGVSTYATIVPASGGAVANYVQPFSDVSGAENAIVPSFHYALPLTPTIVFGFSVVSPLAYQQTMEQPLLLDILQREVNLKR